jgi:hypothetical protein
MKEKKPKRTEEVSEEFTDEEEKQPEDIYSEDSREEMLEGDEITATEEGFMRGWDGTVEGGKKSKKGDGHKDPESVELVKEQYTED